MESHQPFRIQPHRSYRRGSSWLQIVFSVVAAVCLAIIFNLFVFQPYYVDGESMSPTLHSNDRLIVSKVERTVARVEHEDYIPVRGQVIVIDGRVSPQTEASAPHLIKRVVGIPGDRIIIAGGTVRIFNADRPTGFNADSALDLVLEPTYSASPMNVVVPEGSVFVLGDNRAEGGSLDSRVFGMVKSDYIQGRLWMRVLPLTSGRVF